MARYIGPIAWAWLIIIGGLLITPRGPIPISFERTGVVILGVISVALGAAAFVLNRGRTVGRI
jgi:hypothetical protein